MVSAGLLVIPAFTNKAPHSPSASSLRTASRTGGPADAQFCGEGIAPQALTGRKIAVDDAVPQHAVDRVRGGAFATKFL
jgi:hypothetical protein